MPDYRTELCKLCNTGVIVHRKVNIGRTLKLSDWGLEDIRSFKKWQTSLNICEIHVYGLTKVVSVHLSNKCATMLLHEVRHRHYFVVSFILLLSVLRSKDRSLEITRTLFVLLLIRKTKFTINLTDNGWSSHGHRVKYKSPNVSARLRSCLWGNRHNFSRIHIQCTR